MLLPEADRTPGGEPQPRPVGPDAGAVGSTVPAVPGAAPPFRTGRFPYAVRVWRDQFRVPVPGGGKNFRLRNKGNKVNKQDRTRAPVPLVLLVALILASGLTSLFLWNNGTALSNYLFSLNLFCSFSLEQERNSGTERRKQP